MDKITFKNFYLLWVVLFCAVASNPQAGNIVYPWKAFTSLKVVGDTLEVWYKGDNNETINQVNILGRFTSASLPIASVTLGNSLYDKYLNETYNFKIKCPIPLTTPVDLYDIQVVTSAGTALSPSVFKTVKAYKKRFQIVHFTDTHIGRGDGWNGEVVQQSLYMQEILKVTNIIGPAFVLVTGDVIHETSAPLDLKWKNYFEGVDDMMGIEDINTITLTVGGNHDFNDKGNGAREYADFAGIRYYGFKYGDTRVLGFDCSLNSEDSRTDYNDFPKEQEDSARVFLEREGEGKFKILIQHQLGKIQHGFTSEVGVDIGLFGHRHQLLDTTFTFGTNLESEGYVTATAGHFEAVTTERVGWMRVLTIDDGVLADNKIFQVGDPETLDYGTIGEFERQMELLFSRANNGSEETNVATINNKTILDVDSAHVQFIMSPGTYTVDIGRIDQVIKNDTVTIVDVRVPVKAGEMISVKIERGLPESVIKSNRAGYRLFTKFNPLAGNWELFYMLPSNSRIKLEVFNLNGELLSKKGPLEMVRGFHKVSDEDMPGLSAGIYYVKMKFIAKNGRTSELITKYIRQ